MARHRRHTAARQALAVGAAASCFLSLSACTSSPPVPATVERAQEVFLQTAEETGTVGALMLVRTAEGQYVSSYGTGELGTTDTPTAETIFRIGSNTKTFTGTLILQLADEGLIGLDDPVSGYFPGVPNGDDITIAMLLNMHSGLFSYTDDDVWADATFMHPADTPTTQEVLDVAFSHEPLFEPGAEYRYSNTNTVLLGVIAEELMGKTLPELVKERITEPLDLKKTGSSPNPATHHSRSLSLTDMRRRKRNPEQ